jgi:hypothetical protein
MRCQSDGSASPPHQSASLTASPQGEAYPAWDGGSGGYYPPLFICYQISVKAQIAVAAAAPAAA